MYDNKEMVQNGILKMLSATTPCRVRHGMGRMSNNAMQLYSLTFPSFIFPSWVSENDVSMFLSKNKHVFIFCW